MRSDTNDEGVEELGRPQFDQEYLSWWDGVRHDPLGTYGLEALTEDTKEEDEEEESEED